MRGLLDAIASAGKVPLREALVLASTSIDPDDALYRRIAGGHTRDIPPDQFRRVQEAAIRGYIMNPFTRRMAELPKDYMVGEGVSPIAPDGAVQAWLDDFWSDPINQMDAMAELMALESEILGELALPVFVDPRTGKVRLTLVDTLMIRRCIPDPGNTRTLIGVHFYGPGLPQFTLPTILGPGVEDTDVLTAKAVAMREAWRSKLGNAFVDGPPPEGVIYVGINRIAGQTRGLATMSASLDHADLLDRYQFDMLERAGILNAFVWQVTLMGAEDPEITAWKTKHPSPPRPGTVNVTNEKEKWEAVTPTLRQQDLSEGFKTARNYVAGNLGYSPGWLGDTSSTRASAAEQTDPSLKTVTAKQTRLKRILTNILQYVVWQGAAHGQIPKEVLVKGQLKVSWRTVGVQMPEMSPKDVMRGATAFAQLATAVATAVTSGLLTSGTGTRLLAVITPHLGLDLDAEAEVLVLADQASEPVDPSLVDAVLAALPATPPGVPGVPGTVPVAAPALQEVLRLYARAAKRGAALVESAPAREAPPAPPGAHVEVHAAPIHVEVHTPAGPGPLAAPPAVLVQPVVTVTPRTRTVDKTFVKDAAGRTIGLTEVHRVEETATHTVAKTLRTDAEGRTIGVTEVYRDTEEGARG